MTGGSSAPTDGSDSAITIPTRNIHFSEWGDGSIMLVECMCWISVSLTTFRVNDCPHDVVVGEKCLHTNKRFQC